jgi:hypothetical protein
MGTATMLRARFVRFGIEDSQRSESLLDLAAQGAKRMHFLLPQLVIKHAPARLRLKAGRQTLGDANCHLRAPQGNDVGEMVPQPSWVNATPWRKPA